MESQPQSFSLAFSSIFNHLFRGIANLLLRDVLSATVRRFSVYGRAFQFAAWTLAKWASKIRRVLDKNEASRLAYLGALSKKDKLFPAWKYGNGGRGLVARWRRVNWTMFRGRARWVIRKCQNNALLVEKTIASTWMSLLWMRDSFRGGIETRKLLRRWQTAADPRTCGMNWKLWR